jgi:hypothetical protein
MVDPVTGPTASGARSHPPGGFRSVARTLMVEGLAGCVLLPFVGLLFGLLALPWLASGFFFYNAAQAEPAASRYQKAPSCAADGSGNQCLRLVHGTITAVNKSSSYRSASVNYKFSIELPSGIESASVSDFVLVQPTSWPQVGQSVDVTRYGEAITVIAYNGLQIDTNDNPVVHEHDLVITGLIALGFGIVLDGGIVISMRRRKQAPGLAAN